MKITHENDSVTEKKQEMRIGLRISVIDRRLAPTPPQTLKSLSGERLGAICVPSF
jgi:hypothetical protein